MGRILFLKFLGSFIKLGNECQDLKFYAWYIIQYKLLNVQPLDASLQKNSFCSRYVFSILLTARFMKSCIRPSI